MNDLEQWKQDLENYYRNLFFMDPKHKDDWQEAARQAAEAQYQAELQKRQTLVNLPEVTVTASNPTKTVVAESDWDPGYTKFISGLRYYADQDHKNYLDLQRNDMTNSIRETTDKWGKGIGLGMTAAVALPFVIQAAPVIASGIKAFRTAHPIISGAIDAGLTVDGVRNALSDNGVKKTINYATDGNWGRAAASGTMDALDLLGGVGLIGDVVKGVKYFKSAPNFGKVIYDALPTGITKRTIEGLMRQGSLSIPNIPQYVKLLQTSPDAVKYILTGKVPKTFTRRHPEVPIEKEYVHSLFGPYNGLFEDFGRQYYPDLIDAYLYGTRMSDNIGQLTSIGKIDDFGPLKLYINKHYRHIADKIPVYDTYTTYGSYRNMWTDKMFHRPYADHSIPANLNDLVIPTGTRSYPINRNLMDGFTTFDGRSTINVGGHTVETGVVTINGVEYPVVRGIDIWKFNPYDYTKSWLNRFNKGKDMLLKTGVEVVDAAGIPVITRTNWSFVNEPGKVWAFPTLSELDEWIDAMLKNKQVLKSGGSIKIKKKNIGSFTRFCNGKVTEECIRKGKNSSNPTTRKRANFAWVARHKFKHEEGGTINYLNFFK